MRIVYWLRWIATFPVALLCYGLLLAVVYVLELWIEILADHNNEIPILCLVLPALLAGFAGYFAVSVGAYIAPTHKKAIGLTLMIFLCLISLAASFFLSIYRLNILMLAEVILNALGAALAYYHAKDATSQA